MRACLHAARQLARRAPARKLLGDEALHFLARAFLQGFGRAENDRDLAQHICQQRPVCAASIQMEADIFLMRLGQFAGNAAFTRAEQTQGVFQRVRQAIPALEEDQRCGNTGVGRERRLLVRSPAGQKSEKNKGLRGDAAARQGGDGGAGTRQHGDGQPRVPAGPHQKKAGIGQHRHARVGNERQIPAVAQGVQHGIFSPFLIVVMQADEAARRHAPAGAGQSGPAGILGKHRIRFLKAAAGAGGEVFRVAERRAHNAESAGSLTVQ